jgi:excisionase family DNA binding protein
MSSDTSPEFLSVAEVAALLKMNQQTIRNWIDRGELSAVRLGTRRLRVRKSDLDVFLAGGVSSNKTGDGGADPARADLARAIDGARSALDHDDTALAEALRELARSSDRLADLLAGTPPARVTRDGGDAGD